MILFVGKAKKVKDIKRKFNDITLPYMFLMMYVPMVPMKITKEFSYKAK